MIFRRQTEREDTVGRVCLLTYNKWIYISLILAAKVRKLSVCIAVRLTAKTTVLQETIFISSNRMLAAVVWPPWSYSIWGAKQLWRRWRQSLSSAPESHTTPNHPREREREKPKLVDFWMPQKFDIWSLQKLIKFCALALHTEEMSFLAHLLVGPIKLSATSVTKTASFFNSEADVSQTISWLDSLRGTSASTTFTRHRDAERWLFAG